MSYSVSLNRAGEGTGCKGECRYQPAPSLARRSPGGFVPTAIWEDLSGGLSERDKSEARSLVAGQQEK